MSLRSCSLLLLSLLTLSLVACDDLKEFRGTRSGQIVEGSFVRGCFQNHTALTLVFDPDYAMLLDDGGMRLPNTITTSDGTFQSTPLFVSAYLPHDPLSELDFPGPQRLRSYVMSARPAAGPLAGRDAFVVISLLQSGSTEVRIMARSADDVTSCPSDFDVTDAGTDPTVLPSATGQREYFGLWRLK